MKEKGVIEHVGDENLPYVPKDYVCSAKEQAELDSIKSQMILRESFVNKFTPLFIKANMFVFFLIIVCIGFDNYFILTNAISPDDRIINTKVVISVITATTVQLGVIVATIISYLFRKSK